MADNAQWLLVIFRAKSNTIRLIVLLGATFGCYALVLSNNFPMTKSLHT